MTADTPTTEPESQDSVFGKGFMLFLGFAGGLFAAIAIAIPMVIIASNMNFGGDGGGTGGIESGGDNGGEVAPPPETGLPGEEIALNTGCLACHTTDGNASVGPTWQGLAGSERPLEGGETVTADDAYLETSIVDPAFQVVEGFPAVMPPTYGDQLSSGDIAALVEYINSLG
ncbi:MAG: cytochrome c [Actinomycetota bacterium]|nr:cytochrome c [Actinomycetota bacterium]